MLTNYLKVAFRNLWKQKGYTFINVFGLAVGLASCIVILFYVLHEISYDRHHEHSDRIYRVATFIDFSGNYSEMATAPAPMGPTLAELAPEVEAAVRFRPRGSYLVRSGESAQNLNEDDLVYAGPQVFDVFTIPLLHGDPETALERPNTVVISQSAARRHFDRLDVVGETLMLDNRHSFEITGVYEDMPATSHFHFDFMMSMSSIEEANNGIWLSHNFRTYLLLREGATPEDLERHFAAIKKIHIEPQVQEFVGLSLDEFEEAGNSVEYVVQPLTDIHLRSDLTAEFEANGSITYVWIFSGLAAFILLLACINFMNLATARSSQRAREVGVRKTLGSTRRQLGTQFLAESLLLSGIAFGLALLLVELSLPFFSDLAGRPIASHYLSSPLLLAGIVGIVTLTGLLAGSYPALLLSSFKPVRVLKGTFREGGFHGSMRKGLVVFQFSISIVIVIGLLVINQQLQYVQNKSLGYTKEQVVIVEDAYALGSYSVVETFKEQVLAHPVFRTGTISSFFPVAGYSTNDMTFWPRGTRASSENTVNMQSWEADADYVETMGMEIVAGRDFSEERGTDEQAVILNESAARRFGFENPIGQQISVYALMPDNTINADSLVHHTIVGIVKDFHYQSLRENISPLGIFKDPSHGRVAFRIASSSASQAVELLQEAWEASAPGQPFNYTFMDQRFDQMYRAESRVQDLMTAFSGLALVIACLGLFGLSAYSAERRTKEIGIRKVMGAGVGNIVRLMSGEFLKLVGISYLLAVPVAWILMSRWLEGFAYKTELGVPVFLAAGAGALLVALATVSWQSVRAALSDPVDSLRSE